MVLLVLRRRALGRAGWRRVLGLGGFGALALAALCWGIPAWLLLGPAVRSSSREVVLDLSAGHGAELLAPLDCLPPPERRTIVGTVCGFEGDVRLALALPAGRRLDDRGRGLHIWVDERDRIKSLFFLSRAVSLEEAREQASSWIEAWRLEGGRPQLERWLAQAESGGTGELYYLGRGVEQPEPTIELGIHHIDNETYQEPPWYFLVEMRWREP